MTTIQLDRKKGKSEPQQTLARSLRSLSVRSSVHPAVGFAAYRCDLSVTFYWNSLNFFFFFKSIVCPVSLLIHHHRGLPKEQKKWSSTLTTRTHSPSLLCSYSSNVPGGYSQEMKWWKIKHLHFKQIKLFFLFFFTAISKGGQTLFYIKTPLMWRMLCPVFKLHF